MKLEHSLYNELVKEKVDLIPVLNEILPQYYGIGQGCFCPFHNNVDTKAAAIYKSKEGYLILYCFFERKRYTVVDAFKLLNMDIGIIAGNIWNNMLDSDREQFLRKYKKDNLYNFDRLPDDSLPEDGSIESSAREFRFGKITLNGYIRRLLDKQLSKKES